MHWRWPTAEESGLHELTKKMLQQNKWKKIKVQFIIAESSLNLFEPAHNVQQRALSPTHWLTPSIVFFVDAAIISRTLKVWYHPHLSVSQWHRRARSGLHGSTSWAGPHPDSWLLWPAVHSILSAGLCGDFLSQSLTISAPGGTKPSQFIWSAGRFWVDYLSVILLTML